jgi:hypothetical protein
MVSACVTSITRCLMTLSVIPNGMRLTPTSQYLSLNLAMLALKLIAVLDLVGAIALISNEDAADG